MRIDYNIHLDYSDVLLQPKRSALSSRRDVDILRKYKFRNSGKELTYVPVMASNMDGVGTFSMARVLQEFKMLTVIRKHYTIDDWKEAAGTGMKFKYVSACVGTGALWDENAQDYQTLKKVMEAFPDIPVITIDVANAYHEQFVSFVQRIRNEYPDKIIIAGNVVTAGQFLKAERFLELPYPYVAQRRHTLDAKVYVFKVRIAAREIVLHFEVVTLLDLTGDIQTCTTESVTVRHVVVVRGEGVIPVYSAADTELVFSVCGFKSKTVLPSDIDVIISCLSGNAQCCRHCNRDCRLALVVRWYCFHFISSTGLFSLGPVDCLQTFKNVTNAQGERLSFQIVTGSNLMLRLRHSALAW